MKLKAAGTLCDIVDCKRPALVFVPVVESYYRGAPVKVIRGFCKKHAKRFK